MTAVTLPIPIEHYLDRFSLRRRWQRVVRVGAIVVLLSVAWSLLWCLVDRLIGLHWTVRMAALSLNIAGVAAILGRAIVRLLRRRDLVRAAASVERRTLAFGQRLETVISRALGPSAWRGSDHLLDALTSEVAEEVSRSDPAALLPWGPVLRPWGTALVAGAFVYLLAHAGWLDLPRLAVRYAMPWKEVGAVTTTRLTIYPGNTGVGEGQTLRVRASAVRLGEDSPLLHARAVGTSNSGAPWSQQIMSATSDGAFEARLRNVDRDIEYFVTGGDALSERFIARVWRKPAIVRFRIRYTYPPYTGLAAREVENTSGLIEAPVGTQAAVTIESTEALGLAVMTLGDGEAIRFEPSERMTSAKGALLLRQDGPFVIRMASVHGVNGAFRGGVVHALPNRKPLVRFPVPPAGDASASDAVPINYVAADDYGITRLEALVTVRHAGGVVEPLRTIPLETAGARREHGQFILEMNTLGVTAGDTVEVRLHAENRATLSAHSDPAKIVITAGASKATTRPNAATQPLRRVGGVDAGAAMDPPGFADSIRAYFEAIQGDEGE